MQDECQAESRYEEENGPQGELQVKDLEEELGDGSIGVEGMAELAGAPTRVARSVGPSTAEPLIPS